MTSQYSMTIYADPGFPGHFFVGVQGPGIDQAVRGYYPKNGESPALRMERMPDDPKKELWMQGAGEVRDDSSRTKIRDLVQKKIILPGKAAAERVADHMAKVAANPEKYDLINNNCIDFAQSSLDSAGVKQSVANSFSAGELLKIDPAAIEGHRDALWKTSQEGQQKNHDAKREPEQEADRPWEDFNQPDKSSPGPEASATDDSSTADMESQAADNTASSYWDEDQWDLTGKKSAIPGPGGKPQSLDDMDSPEHQGNDTAQSIDDAVRAATRDGGSVSSDGPSHDLSTTPSSEQHNQGEENSAQRKFLDSAISADDSVEAVLEKHPSQWTKTEVQKVQGSSHYSRPGPRQEEVVRAVEGWYDKVYGNDEVRYDQTGRMVEAEPKVDVPDKPSDARDANGRPLTKGVERIARHLSVGAKSDGDIRHAVLAAQKAYNAMKPHQALKEDGDFGPKSRAALRDAVRLFGPAKVEEGLSLGRFENFAKQVRKIGSAAGLASEMEQSFGPLFQTKSQRGPDWVTPDQPRPSAPKAFRPEALALQEVVNELGTEAFGSKFQPVKEDGWIGPKTTECFYGLAASVEPDKLTKKMAHQLGFFSGQGG